MLRKGFFDSGQKGAGSTRTSLYRLTVLLLPL